MKVNELYAKMVEGMPQNIWNRSGRPIGLFCGVPFNGENHQPGQPHGAVYKFEIADFLDELNWPNHDPQASLFDTRVKCH